MSLGADTGADEGLQPERTALAWSRTALGFGAVAGLQLRGGLMDADVVALLGAAAAAAGALAAILVARTRRRELAGPAAREPTSQATRTGLIAGLVVLIAAEVLVTIVVDQGEGRH